jgi:hypothetical protein
LFAFFANFIFGSFIKTELVVVKNPPVVASYEDIIHRTDVTPIFETYFGVPGKMALAPKDSLEGQIWARVLKIGKEQCVRPLSAGFMMSIIEQLATTKAVWIGESVMMTRVKFLTRTMIGADAEKLRGLFTTDPSVKSELHGFVYNLNLHPWSLNRIKRQISRLVQADVTDRAGFEQEFMAHEKYFPGQIFHVHDIDEFISNRIILPHPSLVLPNLYSFRLTFLTLPCLFGVAFVCLVLEGLLSCCTRCFTRLRAKAKRRM